MPFPPFLALDAFGVGRQVDIDNILLHRGRLRDQFSSELDGKIDLIMLYVLGNILAKHFNATFITNDHPIMAKNLYCNISNFPIILPAVQTFSNEQHAKSIYDCFRRTHPEETVKFVRIESLTFNFAYCAATRRKYSSLWNFRIFTDPFDRWTWLVLTAMLFIMSWLISISIRRNFFATFLSALAALLDNEMSRIVNSKLYILWLFMTLLIFDFYSGAITSQLIAPSEEALLGKFSDLEQNNFAFIFYHKIIFDSVNASATMKSHDPMVKAISKLLRNSEILEYQDFFPAFTQKSRNVATMMSWAHSMWVATQGNFAIKRVGLKKLKCHVGKELFDSGPSFIGITPPASTQLEGAFQNLVTTGIYQRWRQENNEMLHSKKVQNRTRVKSRTSVVKEETTVVALKMDGKVVTVFILWKLCLLACCLSFFYEKRNSTGKTLYCLRL